VLSVALTGNVAAGKSTVLKHFAAWGATVIDADQLVREVQAVGSPTLQDIVDHFGREVLRVDGALDRDRLRTLVMSDADARQALNAIVHPAVQERRAVLIDEAVRRGDTVVVNDIPLLFEVLDPRDFDLVVLVEAPESVRLERLQKFRGLSQADAQRLIDSQMPSVSKRDHSDFVIDNQGTPEQLEEAARTVWAAVLETAR